MYKVKSTWTGLTDKLIIDGQFYRLKFIKGMEAGQMIKDQPGVKAILQPDMSVPGKATRDIIVDTEAHANALAIFLNNTKPDSMYIDKSGLKEYETANGITTTLEVLPA